MKNGIEKCIWRIGLDNGSITEDDVNKQKLNCISCDGYDINCKKHPDYKPTQPYFPNQPLSQG
ncbi:MAG: hypothetical protein IB618_00900 [Candidatus Pacearchaeota archaeon]|nr:MAG: hypothetical protein IB618_00900 [Candidatus Pacearchaeota archaeon]